MQKYSVVIVDDEPWALSGLMEAYDWEQNGFQVALHTMDPFAAKCYILDNEPNVALVDIKMKGLDGLSLIQECHKKSSKTVFQIVSAYDYFDYAKKAITLGVFEYLLKPINRVELHASMERLRELLISRTEPKDLRNAPSPDKDNKGFDEVLEYINQHYSEDIRLSILSERFFYSQTYICDLFRLKLKTTLSEYLNDVRLREAYRLITKSHHSTTTVASLVGYNSYSYFSRLFKLRFGISPSRIGKE